MCDTWSAAQKVAPLWEIQMPLSFLRNGGRRQCSLCSQHSHSPAQLIQAWAPNQPACYTPLYSQSPATLISELLKLLLRFEKPTKYYKCSDTVAWKEVLPNSWQAFTIVARAILKCSFGICSYIWWFQVGNFLMLLDGNGGMGTQN